MPKRNYAAQLLNERKKRDAIVRHHARVFMLDMVTIALGRMGWGEKRFDKFDKILTEVSDEYSKLILEDASDDQDIVYSKACLDREIQRYVGDRFVPYDERYWGEK